MKLTKMGLMKPFEKILAILSERNIPLSRFEGMAGLPKNRMQKWGEGQGVDDISIRYAWQIARTLDVPLEWLADTRQDMPPPTARTPEEEELLSLARRLRGGVTEAIERIVNFHAIHVMPGPQPEHPGPSPTPGTIAAKTTRTSPEPSPPRRNKAAGDRS